MRIKSLQISGFKSFVDKTVFSFQPGITAVVGPNGCGKSNVVDAMRWAMGEQSSRRLRGKSMEDVIFAGSEVRAPVGVAEVVLTFDTSGGGAPAAYAGFAEIQVIRRLYRSGESEYLINKAPCRLRDVLDFFRDTGIGTRGYTIVEQGQIAGFVSAKPEERRSMIEAAAGVGKYKVRRVEAERKLVSTEQNLLRLNDVLGELRRQIGSIERQARKAARYKRLRERLQLLELSLAADERRALSQEITGTQRRLAELRERLAAAEARVSEREAGLEQSRLELLERERGVVQGSEALFALRTEIKQLESRIAYERRERETLAQTQQARREELGGLREQLVAADADARGAREELRGVEEQLGAAGDALASAEAGAEREAEAVRTLEQEREQANAALVEAMTGIARSEDRLAALEERGAEIQRRLRNTDQELELHHNEASQVCEEQRSLEEGLRNLLGERDRVMLALRKALERSERGQTAAAEVAERLREARGERERRYARLESLRELLERAEDVESGTRHLLEQGEGARETYGWRALVREVLEADADAERAVEAVLTERAEALVFREPQAALAALASLREADAGRAVFVVEPRGESRSLGFVPMGEPLLDRVRVRPGFEGVARVLLGDANLVSDLQEVLKIYGEGSLPATFVTPLGDVLTPDGVLRGGRPPERGPLARIREFRDLEQEVAELDRRLRTLERESAAAQDQAARAGDEVENLRNRHHTAALAVANHEKDLERTRERVKALGETQAGRASERCELVAEAEAREAERVRLGQQLSRTRQELVGIERRLENLSGRIAQARRALQQAEAALTERRIAHAARLEKREGLDEVRRRSEESARSAREWIARREQEVEQLEERRTSLGASIHEAGARLDEKLREEETLRQRRDQARDAYEQEAGAIHELEEGVRAARTEASSDREQAQAGELELREVELRREHLDVQIRERWAVELASWSPPLLTPEADAEPDGGEAGDEPGTETEDSALPDRGVELVRLPAAERQARLEEVRGKLEALGEVNLAAIEEHEALGERFRFLSEQKHDLESSITSLREAIQRINRTSRRRFRETFEAVNERFEVNFPRLFRGGKASLMLTEAEDVLDAGVEIMAQPPGKRLQSVSLLSGGEKSLTALALLVSLFQVHPSPFFLLDEVDAALDDANVARFNEIVAEMAKESQFLLITHNKGTIEIADVLYGVTMEERGVSKLVAVELHQG